MKKIKALAVVLTVSMLAVMFAGCANKSGISSEAFIKACEKMKLEQIEFDDDPDADDIADGVYAVADEDFLEDDPYIVEDFLDDLHLADVIDIDDVKSFAVALKCTDIREARGVISSPEGIADLEFDGAFAMQMTLTKEGYAKDIFDAFGDLLDLADIDIKDFSKQEYSASKKDGFFRFHIDVAALIEILMDNDDLMDLVESYEQMTGKDLEDILGDITGDIAITVEVTGKNIFVLAGGSLNCKPDTLNSFAKAFGVAKNPATIPMNKDLIEDAIDNNLDKVDVGTIDF